jgi:hypothetical protein
MPNLGNVQDLQMMLLQEQARQMYAVTDFSQVQPSGPPGFFDGSIGGALYGSIPGYEKAAVPSMGSLSHTSKASTRASTRSGEGSSDSDLSDGSFRKSGAAKIHASAAAGEVQNNPDPTFLGEPMKVEMGAAANVLPTLPEATPPAKGAARSNLEESIRRLAEQLEQTQRAQFANHAKQQQQLQQVATQMQQQHAAQQMQHVLQLLQEREQNTAAATTAAWDALNQSYPAAFPANGSVTSGTLIAHLCAELASKMATPYPCEGFDMNPAWYGAAAASEQVVLPPQEKPANGRNAWSRDHYATPHAYEGKGGNRGKGKGKEGKGKASWHGGKGSGKDLGKALEQSSDARVKLRSQVKADRHRTVVALKINRLGFDAEKLLKEHYASFGTVDYVCVPLKVNRVPATSTSPAHSHLRPSGLGFVVMSKESEVQAILAAGEEQIVNGKVINVRAFKQGEEKDGENGEGKDADKDEPVEDQ